jgi:hypothetical protein
MPFKYKLNYCFGIIEIILNFQLTRSAVLRVLRPFGFLTVKTRLNALYYAFSTILTCGQTRFKRHLFFVREVIYFYVELRLSRMDKK